MTAAVVEGRAVVSAAGELDLYTVPALRKMLLKQIAAGHCDIVLDLTDVDFMDSTALGVIVGALKRARIEDGSIRLVCARERVRKIFVITGLAKVFAIYGSLEEALRAA